MDLGISIDFFGTLAELDRDVPTIGQELTSRGYPCTPEVERIWNSTGFDGARTHDPAEKSYGEWRRRSIACLAELCGAPSEVSELLADELIALDQKWTVKQRDGAAALIEMIRRLKVRACILTNWDYSLEPYLRMIGLPSDFPTLTSAETGFRKPALEAFEAARGMLDVIASRHIHIGDDWNADVAGAIRAGGWAMWISDSPRLNVLPNRIVATSIENAATEALSLVRQLSK